MIGHKSNAGRRKKIVEIFSNERVAIIQSCVCAIYKSCHCTLYEIKTAVLQCYFPTHVLSKGRDILDVTVK